MEKKAKAFDAVAESRKWRETTSRKLNAMTRDEQFAHFEALRQRLRAELRSAPPATAALFRDPTTFSIAQR